MTTTSTKHFIVLILSILVGCTASPPVSTPTIPSSPTGSPPTATATVPSPTSTSIPARTDRIQVGGQQPYLLGINYPWLNYGHDFGATAWGHDGVSSEQSKGTIEDDFSHLQNQGVHVIRWFLFTDGRASPEFDSDGKVTGFDEYFYEDLDTALEIAAKHNMYLILVLFDFHLADKAQDSSGVQLGGHSQLITDSEKQQSFLDNALKPLLEKYRDNKNILAWEVMNEPEGAMNISGGNWVDESVDAGTMQTFVNAIVESIHTYSTQYATVGSASRQWLSYWTDSELDFYQYHYYDWMEDQYPIDYSYTDLKLDKPCIVGEFPTNNTKFTLTQFLDTIWKDGYAGALTWSYRGGDDSSDFNSVEGEFKSWSDAHQADIQIDSK